MFVAFWQNVIQIHWRGPGTENNHFFICWESFSSVSCIILSLKAWEICIFVSIVLFFVFCTLFSPWKVWFLGCSFFVVFSMYNKGILRNSCQFLFQGTTASSWEKKRRPWQSFFKLPFWEESFQERNKFCWALQAAKHWKGDPGPKLKIKWHMKRKNTWSTCTKFNCYFLL